LAKVAASLDGKIASNSGDSQWISNEHSRHYAHRLRQQVDAILVGIGTVLADNPRLTVRLPGRKRKRPPLRVILDSRLRTPPASQIISTTSEAPTLIVTGPSPAREKKRLLEERQVEVVSLPVENGRISLPALLRYLGGRDILSIMVEGGAEVHGSFFQSKLVDKVCFFFAPKIIGGSGAVPMVGGAGFARIEQAIALQDIVVRRFGDDIMVSGYVRRQLSGQR